MIENPKNNFLSLSELVGQESIKQRLRLIANTFGNANDDAMPGHMLFEGPSGSGRLAFAQAFAESIHANWSIVDVRCFSVQGDLTAFITNLKRRTVLVLEGSEQLKTSILMPLTNALQTGKLMITIGQGPAARDHFMELHPFTAIFMTSASSRLQEGIRNAATFKFTFQRNSASELEEICLLHAVRFGLSLSKEEVQGICQSSSGKVGNLVKSLQDVSSFMAASNGSANVGHILDALGIIGHSQSRNGDLQQLSGIEFEQQICGLLGSMGFQTEMTRTSGDGGIDIVAHLNQPIVGGRYLFQCKRTTSSFTEQARQFAQQVGIELIDSTILSELLAKYHS